MTMESNDANQEEQSAVAQEFDANAFNSVDSMEVETGTESTSTNETDEEQGTQKTSEGTPEGGEPSESSEGDEHSDWSLDDNSTTTEAPNDQAQGNEESSESVSDEAQTTTEGWQQIAEAIGVNSENYEEFIDTLRNQQDLASKGATNEKINGLNQLKSLEDEQLVRKELEARGFTSDEVEDEIDIMIENNTIRSEARKVRKDLDAVIANETQQIVNQSQTADATQQAEIEAAQRELEEHMSKTTEMFGGKINTAQQQEHVKYISDGNFFDEVTATPQNMAEAAWLWKYRNQILKGMRTKGVEDGKAAILDRMTNPETSRSSHIPDPETGEFNPTRFLDSEQM